MTAVDEVILEDCWDNMRDTHTKRGLPGKGVTGWIWKPWWLSPRRNDGKNDWKESGLDAELPSLLGYDWRTWRGTGESTKRGVGVDMGWDWMTDTHSPPLGMKGEVR